MQKYGIVGEISINSDYNFLLINKFLLLFIQHRLLCYICFYQKIELHGIYRPFS